MRTADWKTAALLTVLVAVAMQTLGAAVSPTSLRKLLQQLEWGCYTGNVAVGLVALAIFLFLAVRGMLRERERPSASNAAAEAAALARGESAAAGGSDAGAIPRGAGELVHAATVESRLRAILREERAEPVSFSEVPASAMWRVLLTAGLFRTEQCSLPDVPPGFWPSFSPFSWAGGEEANITGAAERLSQYLAEAGVRMNVKPGFKLVDVHTRFVLSCDLGRIQLKGKTDAIITPSEQADIHAHVQARVIVDFMTDCPDLDRVEGMSLAELMSASSISMHDVMVVLLDLNERAHIWRAEGNTLYLWQDCSVKQAVMVMADFLNTMCAPVRVHGPDADAVPGLPAAKRARRAFLDRVRGMVPVNEALMDQLEAFRGMGDEGWMAARDVVFSAMAATDMTAPSPS